jgi:septal ring factor EnvC (AmiA/AmiB activator)
VNSPKGVAIVFVLIVAVDGLLFFYGSGRLPVAKYVGLVWEHPLYVLVALLVLLAISVVIVSFFAFIRRRRSAAKLIECRADDPYEEEQQQQRPALEAQEAKRQQLHTYRLEQDLLRLQKEHRKLAEELEEVLEKVLALQREREQERKRIVEGLQAIEQVLLHRSSTRSFTPRPLRWREWT